MFGCNEVLNGLTEFWVCSLVDRQYPVYMAEILTPSKQVPEPISPVTMHDMSCSSLHFITLMSTVDEI